MKRLYAAALVAFLPLTAQAEPLVRPGTCELIVASRQSLNEARAYARGISDKQFVRIFRASNGWYGISVGSLRPHEEDAIISRWKASGRIPQDAYCSTGTRYVAEYDWSSGSRVTASNQPPRPSSRTSSELTPGDVGAALAIGLIGAIVGGMFDGTSSPSSSSGRSGSASPSLKLGCEFVCSGAVGVARSGTIRVNTPYTDGVNAQNYVRDTYEEFCNSNYGFHSGTSRGAMVSLPSCQPGYYQQ